MEFIKVCWKGIVFFPPPLLTIQTGPAFTDVDPNAAYHPAMMLTHRGVKVRPRMQLSHQFVAPGVGVIRA